MRLFDGSERDTYRKWWPGSCLKDAFVCGEPNHALEFRARPRLTGLFRVWRLFGRMTHSCMYIGSWRPWGLGEIWDDTNLRHGFLFSIFYSFIFFFFPGLFFFVFGLDTTCDRKKIEGKCQCMQQLFILHDVPTNWQMATFLGDPTKWERRS